MTIQELNQQYQQICSQIGDAQYKIRQHEQLLQSLYAKADQLNIEAAKLNKSAQDSESTNE